MPIAQIPTLFSTMIRFLVIISILLVAAFPLRAQDYLIPVKPTTTGSVSGQLVVSFEVEELDGVATDGYPILLSHGFAKGDVSSHVTAKIAGNFVPTQTEVKTRYGDGSVKHALIAFVIPRL